MFKPTQSYSSPTTYSKTYDKFRGVDFSSDPSKVASYRSPDAVNMISDAGGMPEKRVGWRTVKKIVESLSIGEVAIPIKNIYLWVCSNDYKPDKYGSIIHIYFVSTMTKSYAWCKELGPESLIALDKEELDGTLFEANTRVYDNYGNYDQYGKKFSINSKLFMLNRNRLSVLSYAKIVNVDGKDALSIKWEQYSASYVPITSINRFPDGSESKTYEPINLLTSERRNRFKGDGKSTTFFLDSPISENNTPGVVDPVTGTPIANADVVNYETGEIKLDRVIEIAGTDDNIEIRFSAKVPDSRIDIRKCTIASNFTAGAADNRLILSGHPDYPNYEWYSASNEGLYIPDINYNIVGLGTSAIKAYCDYGQYQVIAKEGDGTPNVYLRSYTEDTDGRLVLTLTQGQVSANALGAAASLNGQPLFLSSSGIIGMVNTAINSENSFNNVSYFINEKLTQEPNLEKAFAVHHKQKVYVFINGHVYILDGTQSKSYVEAATDDYSYECFYWEDVPATCAISDGETIWFGTADGDICRFNNDMTGYDRYNNYDINGNSTPVKAHWCTALDYDNSVGIAKTLVRKGTTVTLKPAKRTSADIYVRTDEIPFELVAQFSINTPNFNGFSFKGFAFEVLNTPIDVPVSAVVKNYSYLQIKVQNDKLSEPFGLYGITKYFRKGRYK